MNAAATGSRAAIGLGSIAEGPPDAPVLVLGPSLGTTAEIWEPVAAALAGERRVLRFDHRGHGLSAATPGPYTISGLGEDTLALLETNGIERCDYCGVSLGAMIGMWLAANAPERIRSLVVCASSPYMPPASRWTERARLVREAGSTAPIAQGVLAGWLTEGFALARPNVYERLERMLLSVPAEGYAGCCEAIAAMDLRAELPAISAPTLVISGGQDPSAPPAGHGELIAALIAGARLEVLDPGAHMLPVERADEVAALVSEHLRKGER